MVVPLAVALWALTVLVLLLVLRRRRLQREAAYRSPPLPVSELEDKVRDRDDRQMSLLMSLNIA